MANHKRKKPKHQRSGCLMCKPHKDERGKNGTKNKKISEQKNLSKSLEEVEG